MELKPEEQSKISLAHLTALEYAPPELTYLAHRTGFDYVSFRLIHLGLPGEPNYEPARNPTILRETRAALRATGMQALDLELARIKDGVDVRSYLSALEAASELQIPNIVSSIWTQDEAYAKEALIELCEMAATHGCTVNLEFVTWSSLPDLQRAKQLIQAVKQPNLALLIDTLHFYRSRVQLSELDAVPASWFRMVHLCDAPAEIPDTNAELVRTGREARLDPGEGRIALAEIIDRIPEVPYSVEVPNLDRAAHLGYEEHVRLAGEHTRKYLTTHRRRQHQIAS
jgi:sugar phosphate isomerase/epimerase